MGKGEAKGAFSIVISQFSFAIGGQAVANGVNDK